MGNVGYHVMLSFIDKIKHPADEYKIKETYSKIANITIKTSFKYKTYSKGFSLKILISMLRLMLSNFAVIVHIQ